VGQPPVVLAPAIGAQIVPEVIMTTTDQQCYEMFQKMKPPKFQGGKMEDAHEFLTLCHAILGEVGVSSGGRGSHRGSRFFQHHGSVHASMLAVEGGQLTRGSYDSGQGGHGSLSGSQHQLFVPRSCFTCGDPGSTFLYVSTYLVVGFDMMSDCMHVTIHISTPVGESLVVDRVYRSFLVSLTEYDTWVNLIILGIVDLDIILGMDGLSLHHTILDYYDKTMTLAMLVSRKLSGWVLVVSTLEKLSLPIELRVVDGGCLTYLAFIQDTSVEPPPMDSVPVVREFSHVFPTDLLSIPPNRDVDFAIELEPGTKPICIPLYHMTPAELKELKDQL
ncbi:hypothetical protein MTR67_026979, partial [Solanum verrucosum]